MKSVDTPDAQHPLRPRATVQRKPTKGVAADDTSPVDPVGLLPIDLVSALLLWPELDERCFTVVARGLGENHLDWESFRDGLEREGWIEAAATPGAYRVTAAHRPTLETSVAALGGLIAVERAAVAGQPTTRDPALLEDLALRAQATGAWQVLESLWIALAEANVDLTPDTVKVIRDVPAEARKAYPILSWASGAAAAMLATTDRERDTALMDRLLFDSTLIHGDWSLHHETDTAVLAGTIRLVGQRRMPAAGATRGLDAAWATKQEVDAFIEQRTSEGRSPSQLAHSLFRAFSARLAVLRADASIAIQEAHLAQLLSVWEPVTALARGVEALARAMAFDGPAASPDVESLDDQPSEIATLGLTGMGAAFQILATGFAALVRLDRAELDLALSRVSNAAAEVAGLWSVRMALMALRDAVWGSPAEALNHLLAEFANRPPMTNEQNEPLGRSVLGRARVLLLTQTGALAAVQPVLSDMPPAVRAVAVARTALWAGHLGEAVRSAEAGLLQTDLRPADRSRLAIIGAAAALLQGPATPATKDRAARVVDELVTGHILWPLATLPAPARQALVDVYRESPDVDEPALRNLLDRLSELSDASATGAVRLTHRELELLPLLATEESIPEIARALQVSVHTVRTQVATLREKFHAGTRSELVRQAALLGVIPAEVPEPGDPGERYG